MHVTHRMYGVEGKGPGIVFLGPGTVTGLNNAVASTANRICSTPAVGGGSQQAFGGQVVIPELW